MNTETPFRERVREAIAHGFPLPVISGGDGPTDVIAPGTPAPFSQGAADAPTGSSAPVTVPGAVTVVDTPPATAPTPGRTFTADELEAARRQERDKLYPELQSTQRERDALKAQADERLRAETAATEAAAAAQLAAERADMDAKSLIESKEQEWSGRFSQLEAEVETTRVLMARERQHSELQAYRHTAIQSATEDVLPELLDLIEGNTPQEIDERVAQLKARSTSIMSNVQATVGSTRQSMQGTSATAPSTGPVDTVTSQQTFTPADIAGMDEATYAKYRTQLLQAASAQARGSQ